MSEQKGLPSVERFFESTFDIKIDFNRKQAIIYTAFDIVQFAKEYAELVRDETLRIAAEEAYMKTFYTSSKDTSGEYVKVSSGYQVDRESIFNLKNDPRLQIK